MPSCSCSGATTKCWSAWSGACRTPRRRLDFEAAALYRDQIRALRGVRQTQFVASERTRDVDIVALVSDAGLLCVNLVTVRGGLHRGDKWFFPEHAEGYDEAGALEAFLGQHYLSAEVPPLVVIDREVEGGRSGRGAERAVRPPRRRSPPLLPASAAHGWAWPKPTPSGDRAAAAPAFHPGGAARRPAGGAGAAPVQPSASSASTSATPSAKLPSPLAWYGTRAASGKASTATTTSRAWLPGDDYGAMREVLDRRYRKVVAGRGQASGSDPHRRRQGAGVERARRSWRSSGSGRSPWSAWRRARSASLAWSS